MRTFVEQRQPFEVLLPVDFNHVLFTRLCPRARPGMPESVDVAGGPELLRRIADIRGLEGFADLLSMEEMRTAAVRLRTPSPCIIFDFPVCDTPERHEGDRLDEAR
ncbi:MAG: hypothetical protein M0037_13575 [Betaproteobacteria bacterium]|nr:hypothetical protein [Betaproteobacteria bacterium]